MILLDERAKYLEAWSLPSYSDHSPGVEWAELFGELLRPTAHDIVIDFGCGRKRGSDRLRALYGVKVLTQDIVGDVDCDRPLWLPTPLRGTYGYCCDVLEHLPEQFTMLAVANMLQAVEALFLSVSFRQDGFGAWLGRPLHQTVKPFTWWRDSLREVATVVEARDMMGEGVFVLRSPKGVAG